MARAKKPIEEYSLISITIRNYKARVGASINHEAREKRNQHDELRVYEFDSYLEIAGVCTYPEERSGEQYVLTGYGKGPDEKGFDARLKEFRVKDSNGDFKYRKSGGYQLPVYEAPKGIGFLQKERGENSWNGCAWVPNQTVFLMLDLLERRGPVFAALHERKVARHRWINELIEKAKDKT
jgi:hypothetical protein